MCEKEFGHFQMSCNSVFLEIGTFCGERRVVALLPATPTGSNKLIAFYTQVFAIESDT